MTEIVSLRNAKPVGKLVKAPGHKVTFAVPERYKRALSAKDAVFKPAVEVQWLNTLEGVIGGSAAIILLVDAVAAIFVGIPWSVGAPATVPAFWSVYGFSQAIWLAPAVTLIPLARGRRRNFKALVDWLGSRYGIQLSVKQGLAGFVSRTGAASSRAFIDAKEQELILAGSPANGYRVQFEDQNGTSIEYPRTAGAKAPQLKQAATSSLPQELRKVHAEVALLISKLSQRDLSPESDHVVNRAERDIEKVLALYGDLHELSVVTDANLVDIQQVLNQLRTELTEVFQREAQWTLDALKVETTYVKAREERPSFKISK